MIVNGNILVLTQWSFKDALVQTYTLPYVDIIRNIVSPEKKIILVTAEQQKIALSEKELNDVNLDFVKKNMQLIAQPYKRFGLKKIIGSIGQIWKLYRVIRNEKIRTIHAFCTPAGSIAWLLSKISGAALIIDSYEPHAEAMVENGTWKKNGFAFKVLFNLEKRQSRRATALIATTEGMKKYAEEKYGVKASSFFVKPACVNLQKFSPSEKNIQLLKELDLENKIVCVYAGKLGGIYLKDEVFDFIRASYDYWGDKFRFLMLTNASKEEIEAEVIRTNLPGNIIISRFVFHHEVPNYLSLGDFALNPVKPVPTKRYCTSIKDGEYWAMGLPVVISPEISDDSAIINAENAGVVMNFSDRQQYILAIKRLEELLIQGQSLQLKIRGIGEKYRSYSIAKKIYSTIYQ
jgi:glycosyltransferase involved in cell wall biosynthesis